MGNSLSELRKATRKGWLGSSKLGVDKATILDILVYKEVRGLTRDKSMAEVLEDAVFLGSVVPDDLEWYEQEYLDFVRKWWQLTNEMGMA